MVNSVYLFILGVYYSVTSIFVESYTIIQNKILLLRYTKLILTNIILLSLINFIFVNIENYLYNYDNWLKYIYYTVIILHKLIWNIPVYIYCYLISLDSICFILDNGINVSRNRTVESFESKLYFCLVSSIFYITINILYYIPYIGNLLYFIVLSYSYGFFCLEYTCYYKNINSKQKLALIESNPYFFMGFGILYSIFVHYFSYINFFVIFTIFFPFSVMKLIKLDVFTYSPGKVYYSRVFIFPILILNLILSIVDSFILSNYKNLYKLSS